MTLVELSVAMMIFTVATGMLVQIIGSGHGLRRTAREEWLVTSEAQNRMELMRSLPFRDIVRYYDSDPLNDPNGPGTAPGALFAIDGLEVAPGDADGAVGEILLPVVNTGTDIAPVWQVREDIGHQILGLPRDLDGNSVVDDVDHYENYAILPVLIRVRWKGAYGPRELRFFSSLTEMKQLGGS